MRVHGNARLLPCQRAEMARQVLDGDLSRKQAAVSYRVSAKTVGRWVRRYAEGGAEAMGDRSSAPRRVANKTGARVEAAVVALRRSRMTQAEIAEALTMPVSTVTAVCARAGLNRLSRLAPPEPPNRYCRRHPGELVHIDVKKLGRFHTPGHRVTGRGPGRHGNRGAGWDCVHVAVDDATRLAYAEVLGDERHPTVVGFLRRSLAWFGDHGVTVQRIMTDNGSAYRSRHHADACRQLGIRHLRTRPYRPRTNGKAERFIQTLLRGWAYRCAYPSSHHRARALGPWLERYNNTRPHGSLGKRPPATRLAELLAEQRP